MSVRERLQEARWHMANIGSCGGSNGRYKTHLIAAKPVAHIPNLGVRLG